MPKRYTFTSKVVVFGSWRFLGLPQEDAKEIKERYGSRAKGWGSLPVRVTLGSSTWETSIFPDKKIGTYLLPLKAAVRKKEGMEDGRSVRCEIEIGR